MRPLIVLGGGIVLVTVLGVSLQQRPSGEPAPSSPVGPAATVLDVSPVADPENSSAGPHVPQVAAPDPRPAHDPDDDDNDEPDEPPDGEHQLDDD